MLRTAFLTTSKRFSETVLSIAIFVASESLFIYTVHQVGPWFAAIIFSGLYIVLCLYLFRAFQREAQAQSRLGTMTRWVMSRAAVLQQKYKRLIAYSQVLAVLIAGIFAGAVVTTLLIGLLGYRGRPAFLLIVGQTIISVTVWALLYSGALRLFLFH